ncbi:3-mercaptopyruvate sulfurtransferase [Consotaella salsifontis]|uniref:3-mercaptopyruvate sulfurtransferase n=1 Tax=Consotaella salsifontis TaxID=1365950 RepID=A0A1T4LDA3_9HYPH|nr:3-mercaptopyruvate sulfurtransferase [Consotaella salsifontis]SJZ52537.1 thiosulfate/3-mercaptopyruvate sulfurtransferase [Consotaella salsifontis]
MHKKSLLISPQELASHLDQAGRSGLSIVDASWTMPAEQRSPRAEFEAAHIPGAVLFDQDEIVLPGSALPHTLPTPEVFAEAVGKLGIAQTDTIVVYDSKGLFSAPRVWWLFKTFGARDVRVLDGGFPAWQAAGLPVEAGPAEPRATTFTPSFNEEAVVFLPEMREIVASQSEQIADARASARFTAEVPEPRPGLRSGHMPGASNLPFDKLIEDGRLKPQEELRRVFAESGLDLDRPIVTSCGSGVTAAVISLALAALDVENTRLYDGSWTEWGSQSDTPVETGAASSRSA